MIRKLLAVAGTAAAVAAAALGGTALANDTASPSASPSTAASPTGPFTSNTVRVSHAQDEGHHGVWANLEFDRVVTATDNGDGTYAVTMTDDGAFTALAGGKSPRAGADITRGGKGTLHGTYAFTVHSDTAPSSDGVADTLDEGCTSDAGQARTCTNRPSNEAYVLRYFGDGATATAGEYTWTYKTACETWLDSSTNGDGTDADAGDITMKVCDTPPPGTQPVTDKLFSVANVCRVKIDGPAGYVVQKANVWTITNRSGKAYKVHTAVTYGGKRTWFGWDNRGAVQPHSSLTVVSPYGGQLAVEISGYGNLPENTWATATSDHTVLCG